MQPLWKGLPLPDRTSQPQQALSQLQPIGPLQVTDPWSFVIKGCHRWVFPMTSTSSTLNLNWFWVRRGFDLGWNTNGRKEIRAPKFIQVGQAVKLWPTWMDFGALIPFRPFVFHQSNPLLTQNQFSHITMLFFNMLWHIFAWMSSLQSSKISCLFFTKCWVPDG